MAADSGPIQFGENDVMVGVLPQEPEEYRTPRENRISPLQSLHSKEFWGSEVSFLDCRWASGGCSSGVVGKVGGPARAVSGETWS
ncbi:hypothetical protein N7457_002228 [Penicillium paradoxum]|uniref:uncharacterized protein n=1 Tax=Penicillium paradoxum TaxID=176176 RepID=UPI002547DC1C|nr:uncharacterized protein N7457_002228 [Penicillium paradoxum]KAJ5787238.1 hypothetical protein N7457_002228 [Penicillium paradoxum]